MAAPEGSVTVPAKPAVPADCAIRDGTQIANNKVSIATKASRERSSTFDLMNSFSFCNYLNFK
jgi:hypothetical protein